MRPASPTDFVIPVEGIGTFTFAKKSFRDQLAITAEFARLTEAIPTVPDYLSPIATAMATLKVLTVVAPDGWDIEALDPEETESYERLMTVWGALRDKQLGFRKGAPAGSKTEGAGTGEDA